MFKKYLVPCVAVLVVVGGIVFYLNTKENVKVTETAQNTATSTDTGLGNTTASSTENVATSTQKPSTAKPVEIVTTQPQVNSLFKQAVAQETKGDYVGAKASLDAALKLQPNDPYITSYYASMYFHMKEYANALVWINKALALSPTNVNFWYIKFDIVKAQSNNDSKVVDSVYLDAIVKTKGDINMVTAYASWLGSIGEKTKAIEQWRKAIEIYPKNKVVFEAEIRLLEK